MIRIARARTVTRHGARPRGGNVGVKNCWHVRCKACGARRSLPQPIDWYSSPGRLPKCGGCGGREYRRDRYRDRTELVRNLCKCSNAPYPHRSGSHATGGRYGAWECKDYVPF